jgi:hypothetical protein
LAGGFFSFDVEVPGLPQTQARLKARVPPTEKRSQRSEDA